MQLSGGSSSRGRGWRTGADIGPVGPLGVDAGPNGIVNRLFPFLACRNRGMLSHCRRAKRITSPRFGGHHKARGGGEHGAAVGLHDDSSRTGLLPAGVGVDRRQQRGARREEG